MTPQDERLYLTRRLALIRRLTDEGVSAERAQTLAIQWEAEAAKRDIDRQSPDFWRQGAAWVANERRTERGGRSDLLRRVKDRLGDSRRRPIKELGLPDEQDQGGNESVQRDEAWSHQRDDAARVERRRRK